MIGTQARLSWLSAIKPSDAEVWLSKQAQRGLSKSLSQRLRDGAARILVVRDRVIAENPAGTSEVWEEGKRRFA